MSKQTSIQWYSKQVSLNLIKFLKKEITEYELAQENMKVFELAESMHLDEIAEAYNTATIEDYHCGNHYYDSVYSD
jgi:hypothetical protein